MSIRLLYAASNVDAHAVTTDRVVASAAALVALAGLVIGALALARPESRMRRWGPVVALAAGAAGMLVGGIVVATADGGPGTGNGVVGGYAAVAAGLVAVLLGGSALVLPRRAR